MSGADARVIDYDSIADRYDRRYTLYRYDGVRESLENFVGSAGAVLEVGCGTGHWLSTLGDRSLLTAGIDPSAHMLQRARRAAPKARLARGRAEGLPWRDRTFDRVFCINALHHFTDRMRFFEEAHRVLKPGGALMSIGRDSHTERDEWWVHDYFPETRAIDRARYTAVRLLRGEMALAGFAWAQSFEADHLEIVRTSAQAFADGIIERAFTSQFGMLSDEEFNRGVDRIKQAAAERAAEGGDLHLVSDLRLYAVVGRV